VSGGGLSGGTGSGWGVGAGRSVGEGRTGRVGGGSSSGRWARTGAAPTVRATIASAQTAECNMPINMRGRERRQPELAPSGDLERNKRLHAVRLSGHRHRTTIRPQRESPNREDTLQVTIEYCVI
jgi:hypothetical protein